MAELDGISRALVVGLGRSGRAAAVALAEAGIEVVMVDDDPAADPEGLPETVRFSPGPSSAALTGVDLVVPSPGVPDHAQVIVEALAAGCRVFSEPELAWRLYPRTLVGITGTNGKTSTTELVTAMLRSDGRDAVACGNIGTPMIEAAAASDAGTMLVAELSSFQLRHAHLLRPKVGVLLNIADDHLDWHGSRQAYLDAKQRLWQSQGDGDWAVANAQDPTALRMLAAAPADIATFTGERLPTAGESGEGDADGCGIQVGVGRRDGKLVSTIPIARGTILEIGQLPLTAPHHVANVAAAACAAILVGASHEAIAEAAQAWVPGRHRMETVLVADGVTWVNDSKATNPHAAAAALDGVGPAIWIAGGIAKGVDLSPLGEHLGRVRQALLIGEAAIALERLCAQWSVAATVCDSLEDACARAASLARHGDTVLLSPACASFDQFRDYADRGDRFVAAARSLAA